MSETEFKDTGKQVLLKLGEGDWEKGFNPATIEIYQAGHWSPVLQETGQLPPCPELGRLHKRWKELYKAFYNRGNTNSRNAPAIKKDRNFSPFYPLEFQEICETELPNTLDQWLTDPGFSKVRDQLIREFSHSQHSHGLIQLVIESAKPEIRRFPWQLWKLIKEFENVEIALSITDYKRPSIKRNEQIKQSLRILAIVGDSTGIQTEKDLKTLAIELKANQVELVPKKPSRKELDILLSDPEGWDILFFAGHSSTHASGSTGELKLYTEEKLKIRDLENALKSAISNGLKLTIFNSCEGLGLAKELQDLHIPQIIVMREPVPDEVAQAFLAKFLKAFQTKPLYLAVRKARESLQGEETKYPCASWLPVICQNPAMADSPLVWERPIPPMPEPTPRRFQIIKKLGISVLTGLAASTLVMGLRWTGALQGTEWSNYDHLMRSRPPELLDERIVIIEIGSDATNIDRNGYPISSKVLNQLLQKISQYSPIAVGLDIHRPQAQHAGDQDAYAQMMRLFANNQNYIIVCFSSPINSDVNNFEPPRSFSQSQLNSQVGFSDLLQDLDRYKTIRRHLLAYDLRQKNNDSKCTAQYSLSLILAEKFLFNQGIEMEVEAGKGWKSKDVFFTRVLPRFGGYQNEEEIEQILINYRMTKGKNPAKIISLEEALTSSNLVDIINDKVILIGYGADAELLTGDAHRTPYGDQAGVWIHAHVVSQILSSVLDKRPIIQSLPQWRIRQGDTTLFIFQWGDFIFVFLLSTLALGIYPLNKKFKFIFLSASFSSILVYLTGRIAILNGIWIPILPALFAIWISLLGLACLDLSKSLDADVFKEE